MSGVGRSEASTGSWVIRQRKLYLVATDGLRFQWSNQATDALVFKSKAAARRAVGSRPVVIERSIGHEAQLQAERQKREDPR